MISRLLEFTDVCMYGCAVENICTASLGINYAAYHILGRKQTLRYR